MVLFPNYSFLASSLSLHLSSVSPNQYLNRCLWTRFAYRLDPVETVMQASRSFSSPGISIPCCMVTLSTWRSACTCFLRKAATDAGVRKSGQSWGRFVRRTSLEANAPTNSSLVPASIAAHSYGCFSCKSAGVSARAF